MSAIESKDPRLQPENPRRLRAFMQTIQGLSWKESDRLSSLSALFSAVDALAEEEVAYYHRRRGTRAWVSGLTRAGAWVCGSVGLLLPLLAATGSPSLRDAGQFGYAFLGLAASFLAGNSLFGGTDGHVRFVVTQMNLERLITASRIRWCQYVSGSTASSEDIGKGFEIILAYAEELHATTIAETDRWGQGALAALEKYRQGVDAELGGRPTTARRD